jgi:hypothetical protein
VGFLAIMQTTTWTDFINNTAAALGARIPDVIHAETREVDERPEDGSSTPVTYFPGGR